jgi:hypothetical protein
MFGGSIIGDSLKNESLIQRWFTNQASWDQPLPNIKKISSMGIFFEVNQC